MLAQIPLTERIATVDADDTSKCHAEPSARGRCRSLHMAVTGAASVPPMLIDRMRHELGITTVLTGYGLTESTGVVALTDAKDSAEVAATTAGQPIPGVEVKCVGSSGKPLPTGEAGEIWVRGFIVMQGYFEDPAATVEAISEDGWLRTGDLGRFTFGGCLQITDRLKDMYISGGFDCYPAEIERLLSDHPGIALSAVIGLPDARMGEVGKAFVVARAGATLTADAVIAWAKTAMANYKVAQILEVVSSLPTNASGKVQKFILKNLTR